MVRPKPETGKVTGFAGAVEPFKNVVSFARRNSLAIVRYAHGWPIPYRLRDDGDRTAFRGEFHRNIDEVRDQLDQQFEITVWPECRMRYSNSLNSAGSRSRARLPREAERAIKSSLSGPT